MEKELLAAPTPAVVKLVKVEASGQFGDCPYSMLWFEVDGKMMPYALADSALLGLIQGLVSKCLIPDSDGKIPETSST